MKSKWYLANLIEFPVIRKNGSLKILNNKNPLYWDNLILIKASNSEIAYKKAIKYGKEGEYKTINSDGDYIEWKFAGVKELVKVYNPLEDLEELSYSEGIAKTFKNIRELIPHKKKLGIFRWESTQKRKKINVKAKKKKINYKELTIKLKNTSKKANEVLRNINKNI